jgi:hypothetical protein
MKHEETKHHDKPASKEAPYIPSSEEAPYMEPQLGDMTPNYIEWFKKNHSKEEFEARYGTRLPKADEPKEDA